MYLFICCVESLHSLFNEIGHVIINNKIRKSQSEIDVFLKVNKIALLIKW